MYIYVLHVYEYCNHYEAHLQPLGDGDLCLLVHDRPPHGPPHSTLAQLPRGEAQVSLICILLNLKAMTQGTHVSTGFNQKCIN